MFHKYFVKNESSYLMKVPWNKTATSKTISPDWGFVFFSIYFLLLSLVAVLFRINSSIASLSMQIYSAVLKFYSQKIS